MFCSTEGHRYFPFGRQIYDIHPDSVANNKKFKIDEEIIESFREISLHGTKEFWHVRKNDHVLDGHIEELYFKDKIVVWSKGISLQFSDVISTFSMETPVIEAIWCQFLSPIENTDTQNAAHEARSDKCIAIIESSMITFYFDNGKDYTLTIPFNVKNVWVIKNCLLFERTLKMSEFCMSKNRSVDPLENKLAILFSLSHPLDELVPVIMKPANQSKIQFLTDLNQQIVFAEEDPSILLMYDHNTRSHSLWGIRWAKPEETEAIYWPSHLYDNSIMDCTTASHQTPMPNFSTSSKYTLSSLSPSLEFSPLRNLSCRLATTLLGRTRMPSPTLPKYNQMSSRSQSPNSTNNMLHRLHTPPTNPSVTQSMFAASPMTNQQATMIVSDALVPEICLEHLWTEAHVSDTSIATKAFVMSDMTNQKYICYLIHNCQQLRCLKYDESSDKSQLTFGILSLISAKDAIPIKNLQMMLILDSKNNLIIYSGLTKLSIVQVPTLELDIRSSSGLAEESQGPLTSSRPSSAMASHYDEEVRLLSPVLQEGGTFSEEQMELQSDSLHESFVTAFSDGFSALIEHVEERFILELHDGSHFITSLPAITTCPIVNQCIESIKAILPQELALQFVGKWYIFHNTPGCTGGMDEWQQFQHYLLTMLGHFVSQSDTSENKNENETSYHIIHQKRSKLSNSGTNEDSVEMMNCKRYNQIKERLISLDILKKGVTETVITKNEETRKNIDQKGLLFAYTYSIMFALHLAYEDLKLDIIHKSSISNLALLLYCLTRDLKLIHYCDHYFRDMPRIIRQSNAVTYNYTTSDIDKLNMPPYFTIIPPNISSWLLKLMRGCNDLDHFHLFPYIQNVTQRIEYLVLIYVLYIKKVPEAVAKSQFLNNISFSNKTGDLSFQTYDNKDCNLLHYLLSINSQITERIDSSLLMPAIDSLYQNRSNPPNHLSEIAYNLIGREDLAKQCLKKCDVDVFTDDQEFDIKINDDVTTKVEDDGMSHLDNQLIKLRFDKDLRVKEVKRLLQSSRPVRVAIKQRPEVSDHEFIEERESYLYAISIRTMALPIGRGMLMLSTFNPIPTETLHIPKLCLSGRVPPKWNIVEMTHIELPPNLTDWPQFHNGVAAGLKIANTSQLESSWILLNKHRCNSLSNEHAGFLMGQGLNRHLSNLETLNIHDYLIKGHEMTNVGLLLGISADKRGTMDIAMTKVLSIHLPALLPPTSTELDVSHNVQVVAIFGAGLLYQGSAHRHIAEVLLAEIGRPPGPEMENNLDRESYSLAAGFALGNVMLGKGCEELGLTDMGMPDQLLHYMVGGQKRSLSDQFKERYKVPSFQILEGDHVNTDVTSPGATMALALMFFNTNNTSIAQWFVPPETPHMLNLVRPDFLMLRAIAHGLIMWKSVEPTFSWVFSNIPPIGFNYAFQRQKYSDESLIDFDTIDQVFINIVTGCCFVIGLKFAGSASSKASACLTDILNKILRLQKQIGIVDANQKAHFDLYIATILLSLAMVMAGTGDLEVLRYCRRLRERIGPPSTYGYHMAVSMAIGLLLIGGGRCTLCTNPEAIAAMLCAFFPKWPIHTNDNRFHLQAFRHIYALAVERRMLIPRDVASDKYCYVKLDLVFKDGQKYEVKAPYMLPELHLLESVSVKLPRYWPIKFQQFKNWIILETILKGNGCLFVKQRTGYLSYSNDPKGFHGALTQSLARDQLFGKIFKANDIASFTTDPFYLSLANIFCTISHQKEFKDFQYTSQFLYDCISKEKVQVFSLECSLYNNVRKTLMGKLPSFHLSHLLILSSFVMMCQKQVLVSDGFISHLQTIIETKLLSWAEKQSCVLLEYMENGAIPSQEQDEDTLAFFLTYFEIPHFSSLQQLKQNNITTLPALYVALKKTCLPVSSLKRLHAILHL